MMAGTSSHLTSQLGKMTPVKLLLSTFTSDPYLTRMDYDHSSAITSGAQTRNPHRYTFVFMAKGMEEFL
jgi:hypothetical protein